MPVGYFKRWNPIEPCSKTQKSMSGRKKQKTVVGSTREPAGIDLPSDTKQRGQVVCHRQHLSNGGRGRGPAGDVLVESMGGRRHSCVYQHSS